MGREAVEEGGDMLGDFDEPFSHQTVLQSSPVELGLWHCAERDKIWLEASIVEKTTYNRDEATTVAVLATLTPRVWDKSATSTGNASRLRWG